MSSPVAGWRMWEARAADGRTDELLAWALATAPPDAQVYRSADRVVVIAPATAALAVPPEELTARPAYSWDFDRVR